MKKFLLFLSSLVFTTNFLNAQTAWPEFVFHHWVWEDESTQHSALQLVDDYLAHNIPVGAIIIDSPWETGYNTFDWDTSLYPNAQAMVDSFHARGVKVMVWITTAIDTDVHDLWHLADSAGFFMKANAGSGSAIVSWWKGDGSMIDFFNPNAVAWWKTLMDKTLALGIDGWKCDGTDYSVLLGNALYSPGTGGNITRLQYSHAYYNLFYDYSRQQLGNNRIIMSRPVDNYGLTFITDPNLVSFTPREIGFACWVGDQDATFAGMKNALNNMYQSDVNNYLVYGSDIGGYREEPVTNGRDKDLFIRWAQLGTFSGLMENGGGGEHRPWVFDQQTEEIYNMFVRLRYAMLPYLMQQSDSLFNATQSLMNFFNSSDYPFMLGTDIFVAPVLSSSGTVSINFPGSGTSWVYLFDNSQVFQSGSGNLQNFPLDEYPVYIKSTSPLLPILDSVLNSLTGIENINAHRNPIYVFPNPTSGEINISGLKFQGNEKYEFTLFDVLGRNLLNTNLSKGNINIPVAELANGVYYYTINKSPSEKISGKIVVQK